MTTGAFPFPKPPRLVSVNANYVTAGNEYVVVTGARTITLPTTPPGQTIVGVNAQTDPVTINRGGSDTITSYLATGLTSYVIPAGISVLLQYVGGVWNVIDGGLAPGTLMAYGEITSSVTVSGTSGAQTAVVTASTFVADGASSYWVDFYTPEGIAAGVDLLSIYVWEGASQLDTIAQVQPAAVLGTPVFARRKLKPAAGSRTYAIKASRVSSNGSITAGAGGSGAFSPAYISVTKAN